MVTKLDAMTPAQKSIRRATLNWLARVGQPFTSSDRERLIYFLDKINTDSIWTVAIKKVFQEHGDIDKLIAALAAQAVDDPLTMSEIVGISATTLLLRYYDTKNPA